MVAPFVGCRRRFVRWCLCFPRLLATLRSAAVLALPGAGVQGGADAARHHRPVCGEMTDREMEMTRNPLTRTLSEMTDREMEMPLKPSTRTLNFVADLSVVR